MSDIFYIRDKHSLVDWVRRNQSDLAVKAFKMNRKTYNYLKGEMVDVITMTSDMDSKMFETYLTGVPIYFDDSIDDYVVKTEREEFMTYNPKWNPKIPIIVGMIHTLYNLDECGTGGLCHIVTDDDNIKDDDLQWVIDYCKKPENADRVDAELSSWICELMLQLTLEQRAAMFGFMNEGIDIDESIWNSIADFPGVLLYMDGIFEEEF